MVCEAVAREVAAGAAGRGGGPACISTCCLPGPFFHAITGVGALKMVLLASQCIARCAWSASTSWPRVYLGCSQGGRDNAWRNQEERGCHNSKGQKV